MSRPLKTILEEVKNAPGHSMSPNSDDDSYTTAQLCKVPEWVPKEAGAILICRWNLWRGLIPKSSVVKLHHWERNLIYRTYCST